jgi:hypothetical protein
MQLSRIIVITTGAGAPPATDIYRHFIGELQRFTMVPLATALDDERTASGLLPRAPAKSTA